MTDQMSNDNLMTMVLVGLVVYMMLNNKKSCGCNERFTPYYQDCDNKQIGQYNCSMCNNVDIRSADGVLCRQCGCPTITQDMT